MAASCDEAIDNCGEWSQPQDCPRNSTASLHSTSNSEGASGSFKIHSASPGDRQTSLEEVAGPTSTASITAVSVDNVSKTSTKTQLRHISDGLPISHESVDYIGLGNEHWSSPANVYAFTEEGLTNLVPSRSPLTAINLETHARAMPALPASDSSISSWLTSAINEQPSDAVDWSQLVASDPLAAEIEAATSANPHGQTRKAERNIAELSRETR